MLNRVSQSIFLALAACFLVPLLPAQTAVPQSYTLTVSSGMALEAMTANSAVEARVSRFGPREFVDVSGGAPASQPKAPAADAPIPPAAIGASAPAARATTSSASLDGWLIDNLFGRR